MFSLVTCSVACRSMSDQLPPSLTVLVIIDFAPAEAWRNALVPKISAFLDSWPEPIFSFSHGFCLVCWRIFFIHVSNDGFPHVPSYPNNRP
jgi:hypothetical protein